MEEVESRFTDAKNAYQELIERDFPDFDLDAYAEEKARQAAEATIPDETSEPTNQQEDNPQNPSQPSDKPKRGKGLFSKFDKTGDGKVDLADFAIFQKAAAEGAAKIASNAAAAAKNIGETASSAVSSFDAKEAVAEAKKVAAEAGKTIASTNLSELADTAGKIGMTAVGAQGVQDRSAAKNIQEICAEYYNAADAVTEQKRQDLNYSITSFGEYRLRSLHQTVGRFLVFLKALQQKNAAKEYEVLLGAKIDTKTLEQMERVDMAASEALRTTAISGSFGAVAVMGTPVLVTTTVAAFASASTGTAISTLGGAAARSAILAWLGGGSLAVGGGGMAAGAAALAAITVGATAVMTVLSAGTLVSLHYGKKLTEAKEYEKEVGVTVAGLEKAWIIMDGISKRTTELQEVTEELKWKTSAQLDAIEPLVENFDFTNEQHVSQFNKCGILVKTMADLAQTPLLNEEGNLSDESVQITTQVRTVLNSEV